MASSNHNNNEQAKSNFNEKRSKLKAPMIESDKPSTKSQTQHEVRQQKCKPFDAKVEEAIRFVASLFQEGDSSKNNKGTWYIGRY